MFRTHVLNLIVIFFFRTKKLQEEFYSIICLEELAKNLNLDLDIVECIFEYWKLKRKVSERSYLYLLLYTDKVVNLIPDHGKMLVFCKL